MEIFQEDFLLNFTLIVRFFISFLRKRKKFLRSKIFKMKKCDVALCGDDHEYLLKFLLVGDSDVGKNEIADFLGASSSSNSGDILHLFFYSIVVSYFFSL